MRKAQALEKKGTADRFKIAGRILRMRMESWCWNKAKKVCESFDKNGLSGARRAIIELMSEQLNKEIRKRK